MRRNARVKNQTAALNFAENLFAVWPDFRPTKALYLDLEGGGGGNEHILSLYWPQLAGDDRFSMLWRGWPSKPMEPDSLDRVLDGLSCNQDNLEWLVVFSGGQLNPTEQERFESVFGSGWFPRASWVNLHYPMRQSRLIKQAVREEKWAVRRKDRRRVPYSLENLEYQFGYVRPSRLRAHENIYADGDPGECKILETEQNAFEANTQMRGFEVIAEYCSWDVQTMFRIARWCEQNYI